MNYQKRPLSPYNKNEIEESFEKTQLARLQKDVLRLERLYSEQMVANQVINEEQETLEVELLQKEKQIFKQQIKLKELTETNKGLSKKLSGDLAYYEKELINYKHLEKEWALKYNEFKGDKKRYENEKKEKDDEIKRLNNALHEVLNDLDAKNLEITKLKTKLESIWLSENANDLKETKNYDTQIELICEDDSEDELINKSLIYTDSETEEDIQELSFSLANEMNDQLDKKNRKLKAYEFETNSLKNEKKQLYNYINKLLRNRSNPQQNATLKKKLVERKILRLTSISYNKELQLQRQKPKGKRSVSNYVQLKNYKLQPLSTYHSNTDDESEELKDEILLVDKTKALLGHRLLAFKETHLQLNFTKLFIKPKTNTQETYEENDYEEHVLLEIE